MSMDVYQTFADGHRRPRRFVLKARHTTPAPAGRLHAAEPSADVTLCGRPTADLYELGRSRHPFESTPTRARCPSCNELAGRPSPETWTP
jgi:hypothetical protein